VLKSQACVRACGDVVAKEEEKYEDEFFSCVWVFGSSADKDDTFSLTQPDRRCLGAIRLHNGEKTMDGTFAKLCPTRPPGLSMTDRC
jgi:hypothetical protein